MTDEPRTFKTTETSFSVVHAIEDTDGATFSELQSRTELSKSTLYYHLATLEKLGYVVKDDGMYQLGLRFISHGENARSKEPAFGVVHSKARELADRIPEEISFATEENGRLVVVFHDIGGSAMTDFQVGQYLHMHATANGKMLLSEMPEERVDEIIDRWGLPKLTENTITDRDELKAELDTVREQGYAINDEEQREGLRSVGAKVTKPDGTALGSLAVDGATFRLTDEHIEEHTIQQLSDTIDAIENDIR